MHNLAEFFSSIQILAPALCVSFLMEIALVYGVMAILFKQKIHFLAGLLTLVSLIFIFSECMIIYSGWIQNAAFGRWWHRTEQLSGAYYLLVFPYLISTFKGLTSKLKKIIRIICYIGLGVAILLTILAFIFPKLFISQTTMHDLAGRAMTVGDFGRGQEGILYSVRDLFLGVFILGGIFFSIYWAIKTKNKEIYLFVIGIAFAIFFTADDVIFVHTGTNYILSEKYRFSRMSIGLTGLCICFMFAILRDFFFTQKQLSETYRKNIVAESKYRLLAEHEETAIFSLTRNLKFISANNKAVQLFSLEKQIFHPHSQKDFFNYINLFGDDPNFKKPYILESLKGLTHDGESTSFKYVLEDHHSKEPLEYLFKFTLLTGARPEYIVKCDPTIASKLTEFIEEESIVIEVDNYVTLIDEISTRLTSTMGRYVGDGNPLIIKMALQEMLMNAIEHGNLGITFDEKSKAKEEDCYLQLIQKRQRNPIFKDRKLTVRYSLSSEQAVFYIEDEGKGFDYYKIIEKVTDKKNQETLLHGRGLLMTMRIFDKVVYNKKGNAVKLIKKFDKSNDFK